MRPEMVLVPKEQLLEYIHHAETLRDHHDKITQELKDATQLADIIEETWLQRLDKLTDEMLEPTNKSRYFDGLMRAYQIMRGAQ